MPGAKRKQKPFQEKVQKALEEAREAGSVEVTEDLLSSPDFDASHFDDMLYAAHAQELPLRDEGPPSLEIDRTGDDPGFQNVLQLYMREVGRHPLLRPAEERGHFKALRDGDLRLRHRIIEANLRLVVSIATHYRNRGVDFSDLIEDGNLGLIVAVDRFDPDMGNRFSTYASWWIRQSILRGIATQARTVRIPVHVIQRINQYVSAERVLSHRLMRRPSMQEIADDLKLSVPKTQHLSQLIEGIRSLDEVQATQSYRAMAELESEDHAPSFEELLELQEENSRLEEFLQRLSSREEAVLRIRYGFTDGLAHTLAETGDMFGISRERTRQIEKRALKKMRRLLELAERGPLLRPEGGWLH